MTEALETEDVDEEVELTELTLLETEEEIELEDEVDDVAELLLVEEMVVDVDDLVRAKTPAPMIIITTIMTITSTPVDTPRRISRI